MINTKQPMIYLGSDHAAFKLKNELRKYLSRLGYETADLGAYNDKTSDYPDFIIPAAEAAVNKRGLAIVLGGSGIGECIAANKVPGARAALVYDQYTARMSRLDNDANILCLGSRTKSGSLQIIKRLVKIWLSTKFSGHARHKRRLEKISIFEKSL
jgi:ribose 5-phosphate isomerase B